MKSEFSGKSEMKGEGGKLEIISNTKPIVNLNHLSAYKQQQGLTSSHIQKTHN